MKCSTNATRTQVQSLMGHLELPADETWLYSQYFYHLNLDQLSFWCLPLATYRKPHEMSMAMKITMEEMAVRAGPANGKCHLYDIMIDSI